MTDHANRPRPTTVNDLVKLQGLELGPTDWHVLTQLDINTFADITGDRQWIHTDPTRAAASAFGSTIGHGLFTLSLGPAFTEELMAFEGFAHSLNYGYGNIRFPHPRPVGSRVRMRAVITDVTERAPGSALTTIQQTYEADGIDKPVCVAQALALFSEHNNESN